MITLAGMALATMSFYFGRKTATHHDGKQNGTILTELAYIKNGITVLREQVCDHNNRYTELKTQLAALEANVAHLIARIDKHEREIMP